MVKNSRTDQNLQLPQDYSLEITLPYGTDVYSKICVINKYFARVIHHLPVHIVY